MVQVNTVLGPIDSSELGFTLVHEHLLIGWDGWRADNQYTFDRANEMAKAVDMLQELKSLGVQTFVDPCNADMGRDPEYMAEAAQESGMNIIGSTGFYHHGLGIPPYYHSMSEEQIADVFLADIQQGMAGTGIKAGIIKVATLANEVTDQEAKVHRAAGRASAATGVPIITHTEEAGPMGLAQLDLFESVGVNMASVAIGHSCGNGNIPYLLSVLDRGAWLSFDRFGFGISASDEIRIASLMALIGTGRANRVMLAHDSVATIIGRGFTPTPEIQEALKNWHPTHIIKNILPRLHASGVSKDVTDQIMIDNPRRYFEGKSAN